MYSDATVGSSKKQSFILLYILMIIIYWDKMNNSVRLVDEAV